jgi:hypothetical protein
MPRSDEFFEANSDLIRVVSCRELDYTTDLKLHRIVILPLDPLRIRDSSLTNTFQQRMANGSSGNLLAGDAEKLYQDFINQVGSRSRSTLTKTFWLARHLPDAVSWWGWDELD